MCIFNRPVQAVKATRIFVSETVDGRQFTAYANYVENAITKADKRKNQQAMILPFSLPQAKGVPAIQLIDMSGCAKVLNDMEKVFSSPPVLISRSVASVASKSLAVFNVGSYSCSVALSLEQLQNIDETVFKLSPRVREVLAGHYPTRFGFLVCQLTADGEQHPIAYVHHLLAADRLFVPTLHHHGHSSEKDEEEKNEEAHADWDHFIYSTNTTDMVSGETGMLLSLFLVLFFYSFILSFIGEFYV